MNTYTARLAEAADEIRVDVPESDDIDIAPVGPDGMVLLTVVEYDAGDRWDQWTPEVYDAALLDYGWRRVGEWDRDNFCCRVTVA